MKDKTNAEVKLREPFRRFAPSVNVERKDEFFDPKGGPPFKLKMCDVRPEMRSKLPAITHGDGTARVQTVKQDPNPGYHPPISEFEKFRGVRLPLNMRLNTMAEPIIE